uniref:Putative RNA-directed DNA polymerase from transposon BS n=1 Tax=Lygus hesperus TaxID=30085 RepID=A0A0A9XUS8_LYGHE
MLSFLLVWYLGVHLDERLTFDQKISKLVRRIQWRTKLLNPLLGLHSPLKLTCKRSVYVTLTWPIWHMSAVWKQGFASNSQVKRIQTQQNKILRKITNAPVYVQNSVIHRDLEIPEVQKVIEAYYSRLHAVFDSHHNPTFENFTDLIKNAGEPRRLKRKRPANLL